MLRSLTPNSKQVQCWPVAHPQPMRLMKIAETTNRRTIMKTKHFPSTQEEARSLFLPLLEKLSPKARCCDFGLYVREAASPMVNNFTEGRFATMKERKQRLLSQLTEKRGGRWEPVTLAGLFPQDFQLLQSAIR